MKYFRFMIFLAAIVSAFSVNAFANDFETMKTAVENNNLTATESLIAQGFDVNSRDETGNTPLYYAVLNNRLKIAEKLAEAGADVNAPSADNGMTPLLLTTLKAKSLQESVEQELKAADGYTQTRAAEIKLQKYTIRQMALAKKMLVMLIENGADVNQETPYGTPLMNAASNEWNIELVDILLQSGAKINEKDSYGRTALFYAETFGGDEISTRLLAAGADSDIKDNNGKTYMELTKKDFAIK